MATLYYLRNNNRTVNIFATPTSGKTAETALAGASTSLSVSIAASAASVVHTRFWLAAAETLPSVPWAAGDHVHSIDVTVCAATLTYRPAVYRRINSDGSSNAGPVPATQTGTGIKSFTVNASSGLTFNSAANAADIPETQFQASNSSTMTAGTLAFNVDDADSTWTAPWTVSAGSSGRLPIRRNPHRGLIMRSF